MPSRRVRTRVWNIRQVTFAALLICGAGREARAQLHSAIYASGFSVPVAFVQDPTDSTVQYVVQQDGHIRPVRNGTVLAPDFLDLTSSVSFGGERGLLGLVFAPDYAASGRFYVDFTNADGNTVVARFRRSANPVVADPSSRFDLRWGGPSGPAFITQPYANHNGGNLVFGPDGFLYIGMGDGGSGDDPEHRAQNPQELLGKMLRIDVNVADNDSSGYRVPFNNPFVGGQPVAARPEIWSFGLRNPWRYSFDDPVRGGTGALIIGDVGQNRWEEIDYEPPGRGGRNYGWRNREGAHDNVTSLPPAFQPLTEPIHEYDHSTGQSITGGFVYRGRSLGSSYQGRYFFADFVAGRVWSIGLTIDPVTGEATATNRVEHTTELGGGAQLGNVSSFGLDADGELYIVNYAQGRILKVLGTPSAPGITAQPASQIVGTGQNARFAVTATGAPLPDYQWQVSTNGGSTWSSVTNIAPYSGATTAALIVSASPAVSGYQYRCVVSNSAGSVTSSAATLTIAAVALNPSSLRFGATKAGATGALLSVTPPQDVTVTFAAATSTWTASVDQPWVKFVIVCPLGAPGCDASNTAVGHGTGQFTISIVNPGNVIGASSILTATVTVSVPGLNTSLALPVTLVTQLTTSNSSPPFGSLDTPANGATGVIGAIPISGWALDDIAVARVQIWRNCVDAIDRPASACFASTPGGPADFVYIGNGAFLPSARPDVEAAFPTFPAPYRGGWGYLLSTNALPHVPNGTAHGGQGTFTLSAYAVDDDNQFTLIGTKSITLDNDHATIPFGTIDTPAPGETLNGVRANFGWAMTQNPKCIDTTTIASYRVYIDGVSLPLTRGVNWFPGLSRSDIAAAYPGLCNTNNALAAYDIDVMALGLTNGLHTTGWDVIDSQGKIAGIGSRFFNVLIGSSVTSAAGVASGFSPTFSDRPVALGQASALDSLAIAQRSVHVRVGPNEAPFEPVTSDSRGQYAVQFGSGSRMVLDLGGPVEAGYQLVGDELRALPGGSTFDAANGQFAWQPPVPFLGPFHLVFTSGAGGPGGNVRLDVLTTIADPTAAAGIAMHVDTPAADAAVNGSFVVAGWALDPLATTGSGIDTLHVWAYRRDGVALPQFLGAAAVGGTRPDVAAIFGTQFEASGFTLTTSALASGVYDLLVYPWSHRTGHFEAAQSIRVTIR